MLFWTLQIAIISIILIFLVHHLIIFFKNTLTIPKVKDLVNAPAQKYENIYNTISANNGGGRGRDFGKEFSLNEGKDYTDSLLPPSVPDLKSMKDELKSFLKNKIKEDSGTSSIESLDSFNSSSFASY